MSNPDGDGKEGNKLTGKFYFANVRPAYISDVCCHND